MGRAYASPTSTRGIFSSPLLVLQEIERDDSFRSQKKQDKKAADAKIQEAAEPEDTTTVKTGRPANFF